MSLWKQIVGRWGSGAGEQDEVRIDGSFNALIAIRPQHHEIHEGDAFSANYEQSVTNTNDQTVIAFNTPNTTKWIHMVMTGHVTSISRISVAEVTSIDVDEGTQLVIYNRNRNSANESVVTSIEAAPVANKATSYTAAQATGANITETTRLDSVVIGSPGVGGSGSGSGGGSGGGRFEFILKQNTQYAFIIESLDDSDNIHTVDLNWYEHTAIH